MLKPMGQFTISKQQNQEFAALSGDYNPLHVDEVYSRRLQFGQPVIHGIHHLLRTWDEAYLDLPRLENAYLTQLNATFPNPVSINQPIEYSYQVTPDGLGVALTAYNKKGQVILSLSLQFASLPKVHVDSSVLESLPPVEAPIDQTFPPKHSAGECQLYLDTAIAQKSFPRLFKHLPSHLLAQILACTRVVGMKCPGLNSIFSRIKLDFNPDIEVVNKDSLYYFEAHKDERFSILKLGVEGQGMKGSLDTFFRPTPVAQPSYSEVCLKVADNMFSAQRALVIGGSRGVGEITAKILAAGGADVIITYNKGREEADRVATEITQANARCRTQAIDVTSLSEQPLIQFEGQLLPTHIYYFASPHILANNSKDWDNELFIKFCRFYLDAFHKTVKCYAEDAKKSNSPITFFYPSTIFIDQPEKGFSEYAVAKGAGEALCKQLTAMHQEFKFVAPRLPRMQTDQTSSIIPIKCDSASDVMLGELRNIDR